MRDISMTEEDKQFMELRDRIFEVIPQGEDNAHTWARFREYMDFYYKSLPGNGTENF